MERIEKTYAIIHVDWDGESLKEDKRDDFTTEEIITDYYNGDGLLQWNHYLIIPKEIVEESKIPLEEILNNEKYTRKLVIPAKEINTFVENRFPDVRPLMGKITLIKGNNWAECFPLVQAEQLKNKENNELYADVIGSWYRDESLIFTLTEMDKLRARLITNPALNIIFYTHNSQEFYLAKKKFNLFIEKPVEEKSE